jgi:hypothetical protein
MGFADYYAHILVDSLAILFSPTGESSLSIGRAGLGAMGTSDERRVRFTDLHSLIFIMIVTALLLVEECHLPEVTQIT